MTTITITPTIKTRRKVGPDGNFNAISTRIVSKAPIIGYRTAQAIVTTARLTAPQPPRQAWWYTRPPNPRTGKTVPPGDQYVRTGDLKASVVGPLKFGPLEYYAMVNAPYAPFVEHGTRFMPPQPFWANSVKHVRHEVLRPLVKKWMKRGGV
jgi:HK97 gp10 family phage protein